jgi:hypothetical protein
MVIFIGFSCVESAFALMVVASGVLQTRRPQKIAILQRSTPSESVISAQAPAVVQTVSD